MDSALGMPEELRRFRGGLDSVATLDHGAPTSRDELVSSFFKAVKADDKGTLRALHLSRSEFAYLYFPSSPMALPPYELSPPVNWLLLTSESNSGITKLITHLTNSAARYDGYECADSPVRQGEISIWGNCMVRLSGNGAEIRLRAFGAIMEHRGRFKFISYANGL